VVAALLTTIGYSINDTIVIFDRIRENLAFSRREDMPALINNSINQSLSRTIITSLTTLIAVVSIFLFAGDVLRDFSFLLIIGIVVGTYSSIAIASPLYLALEQQALRREMEKKGGKKSPVPV
jgi:preprotein translocase subunit SecF